MAPRSDDDLAPESDPLDLELRSLARALVDETWPDDPAVDELVLLPPPVTEDLLIPVPDDDGSELEPPPADGQAPIHEVADPLVLPWVSAGQVDGFPVRVVADTLAPQSTLFGVPGASPVVRVRLLGVVFDLAVARSVGEPELRLGRDGLRGRFLVWVEGE